MALILNIETATTLCSVALTDNGKVIDLRETTEEKSHASKLTMFIEEIINESGIKISDMDAIAVGKGPGSYTGLRIGVSVAKGLSYGSKKPLIAVSTLMILYKRALLSAPSLLTQYSNKNIIFCPMIDARRMEIFTCLINASGKEIEPVSAKIVDENTYNQLLKDNIVVFFGTGMEKCRKLLEHPNSLFIEAIQPSSDALALIAEDYFNQGQFEDTAYFEPFYLKDFVATVSKRKPLT